MIKSQKENLIRLYKAFERRNEEEFKFILDTYAIKTDVSLECIGINMSIIEYILQTPNSRNFIQICLYYGLDFYKKNSKGQYLAYYAIKSMSAENLEMLINYSNCLPLTDPSKSLAYQLIINCETGTKNNNFLHDVIENLKDSNYNESLKMIELLISCGCNPNHLNDDSKSPLDILLEKVNDSSIFEIVSLFLKFQNIEISNSEINRQAVNALNISDKVTFRKHNVNDISELFKQICNRNEVQFVEGIKSINQSLIFPNFRELLKLTIQCNFTKGTIYLLKFARECDNPKIMLALLKDKIDGISPFFYALCLCRCDIIEEFLKIDSIKFDFDDKCWNVLHEICSLTKHIESDEDFQKSFDLIINDRRCTKDIINGFDNNNKTPLMHACENGHDKIALELLRRGAYIGHKSVLNNLSEETLKKFLDECIVPTSDLNDKDCSVQINYNFLISPDICEKETKALDLISSLEKFKNLVIHPVFASFLELKWKRLNFLIYIGIFLHFIFLIYMSIFILNFFDSPLYNTKNSTDSSRNAGMDHQVNFYAPQPPDLAISSDDPLPNIPGHESQGGGFGSSSPTFGSANNGFGSSNTGFSFPSGRSPAYRGYKTISVDNNVELRGTFDITSPPTTTEFTLIVPYNEKSLKKSTRKPVNVLKVLFLGRSKRDVSNDPASITETQDDTSEEDHIKAHATTYLICLLGTLLLTLYEISQFIISRKNYFLKLSNWVDCFLLGLSYYVLTTDQRYESDFRYLRALFFLVLAVQCFILIARVSKLSLQLEIFKKVCKTFLKFLLVYSMLIFAFAMAFYTLYNNRNSEQKNDENMSDKSKEEDDDKSFDNIFISTITVIRMMLADFESIKLNPDSHLDIVIFLSFILLISVILINLLNALAINDTNEIMKFAEIVDVKKRISMVISCEKILVFLRIRHFDIFTNVIVGGRIILKINQDKFIRIRQALTDVRFIYEENKVPVPQLFPYHKIQKFIALSTPYFKLGSETIEKIIEHIQNLVASENEIKCMKCIHYE